jgi:hypothetical protein
MQLQEIFPREVIDEITAFTPATKAMVIWQLADEVSDRMPEFADQISATTMQWLTALTTKQAIHTINHLSTMLLQIYED